MDFLIPPCNSNQVINLFSDNLHKYLEHLLNLHTKQFQQINDLNTKINNFEETKELLKHLSIRFDSSQKNLESLNSTLTSQQLKILSIEKLNETTNEKVNDNENYLRKVDKRINDIDDKIITLNTNSENNSKSIDQCNFSLLNLKSSCDELTDKTDNHEKNIISITKQLTRIFNLETSINELRAKVSKKNRKLKNNVKEVVKFNLKNESSIDQLNMNLIKFIEKVNSMNDNFTNEIYQIKMNNQSNIKNIENDDLPVQETYSKSEQENFNEYPNRIEKFASVKIEQPINSPLRIYSQMSNTNEKFELYEIKSKLENLSNDFNELKSNLKLLEKSDSQKVDEYLIENQEFEEKFNKNQINKQGTIKTETSPKIKHKNSVDYNEIIFSLNKLDNLGKKDEISEIKKELDNIQKTLILAINTKLSKEDFEKFQRNQIEHYDKLELTFNKNIESALEIVKTDNSNQINNNNTNEKANLLSKEEIESAINEGTNKILENNKIILDLKELSILHQNELSQIKNQLNEISVSPKNIEIINPNTNFDSNNFKFKIDEIENYIKNLENVIVQIKLQFEENNKIVDDNDENRGIEFPITSLKDSIINLKSDFKSFSDKVEKLQNKQESITAEVLFKVKKDISIESLKVLEEFRGDLKHSISKIDEQLQKKVDHINLDDLGKKFDFKLTNEISKKIDKNDLKKSNIYLTKKIDTLENKISRTLVDTLIDLQMEDMPLIVKKGVKGEKCASCNQTYQNNGPNQQVATHYHQPEIIEDKYKLRMIQDNSNKYGTGSYSRVLSNANPEILTEELKSNFKSKISKISLNQSLNLPEIKIIHKKQNKKSIDETNERKNKTYLEGLNEELLHKRIISPDIIQKLTSIGGFEENNKKTK